MPTPLLFSPNFLYYIESSMEKWTGIPKSQRIIFCMLVTCQAQIPMMALKMKKQLLAYKDIHKEKMLMMA